MCRQCSAVISTLVKLVLTIIIISSTFGERAETLEVPNFITAPVQ